MAVSFCVINPLPVDPLNGWEQERPTWPHHEASRFVLASGIRWHVQGMGQGPPMLLVHGTGASTHSWRNVMPLLARRYSVTAIDLPGHAFTDPLSPARTSIEGMSAALAALLQTMQVSPAYCVGHSAGAVILCKMALDQHICPRRIVSVNGAFLPLGGAASRVFAPVLRLLANNAGVARLVAPGAHRARAAVTRLIARTGSTLDEEGIELYARLVSKSRHVAGALRMMGNWSLHGFQKSLSEIAVPMTLIVGGNDLMVPPRQAALVQRTARHASVSCLPGLGHLAHEEKPALIADEVAMVCDA
jgi:magnesium chelatase accessory protein